MCTALYEDFHDDSIHHLFSVFDRTNNVDYSYDNVSKVLDTASA